MEKKGVSDEKLLISSVKTFNTTGELKFPVEGGLYVFLRIIRFDFNVAF